MGPVGFNGGVFVDIPPSPNVIFLASTFPVAAPARTVPNRADAFAVSDMQGLVTLTHNGTNATLTFTLLQFLDCGRNAFGSGQDGIWLQNGPPQSNVVINGLSQMSVWKMCPNLPIYIFASAPLTGTAPRVVIGGITIQGNVPVVTAGA